MRTTLDIPADVMRSVKVLAAHSDRSLTDTITALLRAGLGQNDGPAKAGRVVLPLVRNARQATADELSPDRIAGILSAVEVDGLAR